MRRRRQLLWTLAGVAALGLARLPLRGETPPPDGLKTRHVSDWQLLLTGLREVVPPNVLYVYSNEMFSMDRPPVMVMRITAVSSCSNPCRILAACAATVSLVALLPPPRVL